MSQKVREEMLPRLRQRYVSRGRAGKSRMIDELCEQFGDSRKHAIKLLNARTGWGGKLGSLKGRPPACGAEVVEVLKRLWQAAEQPCGKRLASLRKRWLPYYEEEHGKLPRRVRRNVLKVSAAQIDRLLKSSKAKAGARGRCGTKPGSLLKTQIPIRTSNGDITVPGYLEADTVAHCGGSLEGDFIWSVTRRCLDPVRSARSAIECRHCLPREGEGALPFEVRGFDCDNGSEFLNWHLVHSFTGRKDQVGFTRSRPCHKNDNGHVEQKNSDARAATPGL